MLIIATRFVAEAVMLYTYGLGKMALITTHLGLINLVKAARRRVLISNTKVNPCVFQWPAIKVAESVNNCADQ